jgi:hypothetical protein
LGADRTFGRGRIEVQASVGEALRRKAAEHEMRIGYGGMRAAAAVTRRARTCAGTLRAHVQTARFVDPGDAAAARADFLDVEHRNTNRQAFVVAADEEIGREVRDPILQHARFRGRPAHVEADEILRVEPRGEHARTDDAGGRPRLEHLDALRLRRRNVAQAAARLHDQQLARERAGAQSLVEILDIPAHARADVGVRHGRGRAFVFAIFARDVVRGRDEQLRIGGEQDLAHPVLVIDVRVRVQKDDRNRLDTGGDEVDGQRRRTGLIERLPDRTVVQHALGHLEHAVAGDQRHVFAEEQIERIGPVDAPDFVDVAEPFGRDQRGLRALAFEDRIDGDGRTVDDELRRRRRRPRALDRGEDAVGEIFRRTQRFAERHGARRDVHDGHIGERPADVDRDAAACDHASVSAAVRSADAASRGPSGSRPKRVSISFKIDVVS